MVQPRVLLFPFPAPGHIKPFFCLAELLSDTGLEVIFLSTEYNKCFINNLEALSLRLPTLHIETISDGLPLDRPLEFLDAALYLSIRDGTKPLFRQLLQSLKDDSRPITCIVSDVLISFPFEVAEELGIPVIAFCPYSARYLSAHFWIPKLVEEGQIPYSDDNPSGEIYGLPMFEGLLRRKDLPGFWNSKSNFDESFSIAFVNQTIAARRSSGLILNTFDELEAPILTHLSSIFNKVYTIGPLHALLNSKLNDSSFSSSSLSGFWKEDQTCMSWLDSQPTKSVIFVSFGSITKMKAEELVEFWQGLINSGKPFLCVLRKNLVNVKEGGELIKELVDKEGEKLKGIIVNWAPQEKVLNHPSIGGFLTHCGWNSTMESIVAGVPMICWPRLGDQPNNATLIDKVWKIGLEIEDGWDRLTVEKMIRALIEENQMGKNEIHKSIEKLSKLANERVSKSGLSFHNLEILTQDIKKLGIK